MILQALQRYQEVTSRYIQEKQSVRLDFYNISTFSFIHLFMSNGIVLYQSDEASFAQHSLNGFVCIPIVFFLAESYRKLCLNL